MQIHKNKKKEFVLNTRCGYNDCMNYDDNLTFQQVLEAVKLTEKQYNFFKNLVSPESDTVGDLVKSYIKAGYADNPTVLHNAHKLHSNPKFQRVLTAYRKKELEKSENREMTIRETVTQGLMDIAFKAKRRGDLSVERQVLMDLAKLGGLLVERHQVIDPATELDIDKSMKLEAAKLAEQRLLNAPNAPIDIDRLDKSSSKSIESRIIDEKEGKEPSE